LGQQDQGNNAKKLGSMGIEDLMKVEVTIESKEPESLSKVPAAVYVLTAEEIRRSGASNIPEALRAVPGVQVAQQDPSKYVVSIRGMGERYSNKLLVLVDGRSVYTPLFSGVYWDAQALDIDQVERIEVIRGPGGTLWGANAVNGIINIITKSAKDTLGDKLTIQSGTTEPYNATFTHGGELSNGAYRLYARAFRESDAPYWLGPQEDNQWNSLRLGGRADWSANGNDFTFTSDISNDHQGEFVEYPAIFSPNPNGLYETLRYPTSDWNATGRWTRAEGRYSGTSLQASVDHYDRGTADVAERNTNVSIDFQSPIELKWNRLVWGLGYHLQVDDVIANPYIVGSPATTTEPVYSGFLHDEMRVSNKSTLTLGTKIEHNGYTGWELQPTVRYAYEPTDHQTFWGAISRAVRTPSRADENASIFAYSEVGPGGLPTQVMLQGDDEFRSEEEISAELGWRTQANSHSFFDAAGFISHYRQLRGLQLGGFQTVTSPDPYNIATYVFDNSASADTAGIELSARTELSSNWRLLGSYSLFSERYSIADGNPFPINEYGYGSTPRNQASIKSQLDLPHHFEFDVSGFFVSGISAQNIAPYGRLDLRLGWKPNARTDVSIGVTNLTSKYHLEAPTTLYDNASLVQQNFYAKVGFRF
jgi:iron complex outermembrane receptor protein